MSSGFSLVNSGWLSILVLGVGRFLVGGLVNLDQFMTGKMFYDKLHSPIFAVICEGQIPLSRQNFVTCPSYNPNIASSVEAIFLDQREQNCISSSETNGPMGAVVVIGGL